MNDEILKSLDPKTEFIGGTKKDIAVFYSKAYGRYYVANYFDGFLTGIKRPMVAHWEIVEFASVEEWQEFKADEEGGKDWTTNFNDLNFN